MSAGGTVRFDVPAVPAGAGPVVEVRDHNLRLVDRAVPGSDLRLAAGMYLASVLLPTGESDQQAISVAPGDALDVHLGPDAAALADAPDAAHEAALAADLPRDLVVKTGDPAGPATWYGRLLRLSDGAPLDAADVLRAHGGDQPTAVTDLTCTVPRGAEESLLILQVAVRGQVPFNCVLPLLPGRGTQTARVRVVNTADAIRASALPIGGGLTDAVAGYVATGHLRQAAHVVANARELLFGKVSEPIGAALGGYALLRLGRLGEIAHWVDNLAEWIPTLPDGAVIAAEQAARDGRSEQSEEWLREAVRRGTPVFADGLSLLVSRLRPRAVDADADATRLLGTAAVADFSQLVVAFGAADPLHPTASRHAVATFDDPADGWRRFGHDDTP